MEYVSSKTHRTYYVGGCNVSRQAGTAPIVGAAPFQPKAKRLPPSVNLRKDMTKVKDQSSVPTCSANAVGSAYEFEIKRKTGKDIDVSRLFIYNNGRAKDHNLSSPNGGASIVGVISGMQQFGSCSELVWEYRLPSLHQKPSRAAYARAKDYRVTQASELPAGLTAMKSCLAEGHPFVFALKLFVSFKKAESKGHVALPGHGEPLLADHSLHGMIAVGYSDNSQCFIVQNSWGTKWGDKGYCYIPYSYMANPVYCTQRWMIKSVSVKSQRPPKVGAVPKLGAAPKVAAVNLDRSINQECEASDSDSNMESDSDDEFNVEQFWIENDTYDYYTRSEPTADSEEENECEADGC